MLEKPACPNCLIEMQSTTKTEQYFDRQEQINRDIDVAVWKCEQCSFTQPVTIEEKREMRLWENKIRFREQELAEKKEKVNKTVSELNAGKNQDRTNLEKSLIDRLGVDICLHCKKAEINPKNANAFCTSCYEELTSKYRINEQ